MEYSNRHKVSISTLRRKIKSNDLTHQFIDGKYYLLDNSLPTQRQASGPETIVPPTSSAPQDQEPQAPQQSSPSTTPQPQTHVCETAESLLGELKRAYSMILQEKEEQILQLREEVSDLQTLVRVLESEVQRLNKAQQLQTQAKAQVAAPIEQAKPKAKSPFLAQLESDLNLDLDSF